MEVAHSVGSTASPPDSPPELRTTLDDDSRWTSAKRWTQPIKAGMGEFSAFPGRVTVTCGVLLGGSSSFTMSICSFVAMPKERSRSSRQNLWRLALPSSPNLQMVWALAGHKSNIRACARFSLEIVDESTCVRLSSCCPSATRFGRF